MGALWPGGPWEPPVPIALGNTVHQWGQMMPMAAMAHVSRAEFWELVTDGISERDRAIVLSRIKSRDDDLERHHVQRAGVHLAIGLVGIETGIKGFRAAMRICGTVMGGWPSTGGLLAKHGVDVSKSPVWKTAAVLYHLLVENPEASKDDRIKQRHQFYLPLPGEPKAIFADAGEQVRAVSGRESASAFQRFQREYEASRPNR